MNRSKLIEKGDLNIRARQPKPYEMGVQVPHTALSEKTVLTTLAQNRLAKRAAHRRRGASCCRTDRCSRWAIQLIAMPTDTTNTSSVIRLYRSQRQRGLGASVMRVSIVVWPGGFKLGHTRAIMER